jgi:hypothetical protein
MTDFYFSVSIDEISHKVWFSKMKEFASCNMITEEHLKELCILVKEDMPSGAKNIP